MLLLGSGRAENAYSALVALNNLLLADALQPRPAALISGLWLNALLFDALNINALHAGASDCFAITKSGRWASPKGRKGSLTGSFEDTSTRSPRTRVAVEILGPSDFSVGDLPTSGALDWPPAMSQSMLNA